ncbi:hypothetical protein [Leptospira ilyithenensis]|uniref:hypothetical protein n=1 Tax=Leptospira ilyithenensis TaxID=2484901 RepID=UPI0014385019|nr:hypothetical protein [Leptospira ilyithenensis]
MYQKTGLRFLILLSFCSAFLQCQGETTSIPSSSFVNKTSILNVLPKGKFKVEDLGTHLLLHGFSDPDTNKSYPLLWDTGSDISFVREHLGAERDTQFRLRWEGKDFPFKKRKGILPESLEGLVGNDFFDNTCVWWENGELQVFDSSSSFCEKPQAFLTTSLRTLSVRKWNLHYYASFKGKKEKTYIGILDTGASLSLLPFKGEEGLESQGKKKVFLPGNQIQEADLFYWKGPLYLGTNLGIWEEYFDIYFLSGISLENFLLSRDKDREEVWVIGLDILRRKPLFWDFARNRIAILNPSSN